MVLETFASGRNCLERGMGKLGGNGNVLYLEWVVIN